MFNDNLGKFLAELRQANNLTQEQLANKLHIDKRKISRWETGTSPPEFELLVELQEIFHVSLYELSICQKIEDKRLLEKAKLKFKTMKDLKQYTIKQKVISIIAILLGIFLGLCAVFTVDNYGTVEVYSLKSLDENFTIVGNYVKTKDIQMLNVTKLEFLESQNNNLKKKDLNIDVYDIDIEIKSKNIRIITLKINSQTSLNKEKHNLLQTINNLVLANKVIIPNIYYNDTFTFTINYKDENYNAKNIQFNFRLQNKFENTL